MPKGVYILLVQRTLAKNSLDAEVRANKLKFGTEHPQVVHNARRKSSLKFAMRVFRKS